MNLGEILSQRESIANEMKTVLDVATAPWGVMVERVEVRMIMIMMVMRGIRVTMIMMLMVEQVEVIMMIIIMRMVMRVSESIIIS